MDFDPKLDLKLERYVDVPKERVWAAWTTPEHLMQWFCPRPWKTVECDIDLRPGGLFRTVMQSPEGVNTPNVCCYLEVVKNERLIWTDTLLPGFRPSSRPTNWPDQLPNMTIFIYMETQGKGTKYTAMAKHRDEAGRKHHDELGFNEGWSVATDQLIEVAKAMK